MRRTNDVLSAIADRISDTMSGTVDRVLLIEGSPSSYILRLKKGIYCFVSYRNEMPARKDASGAHFKRGMVIGIALVQVHTGTTSTPAEIVVLNDAMDDLLDYLVEPQGSNKWWSTDANICGLGPNEITAIASPEGDFTGRDMLFNVMVN